MAIKKEINILHNNVIYTPVVADGMKLYTAREGEASKLTFKLEKKANAKVVFTEGDVVALRLFEFYGYIFEITDNSADDTVEVTAYDQLRYFKAKDTYVFINNSPEQAFARVCDDYELTYFRYSMGTKVNDYGFTQVCENTELFDIMKKISDYVLQKTGRLCILYDNYGTLYFHPLTYRAAGSKNKQYAWMTLDATLTLNDFESYTYTTSIDKNTYNRIKVIYDNDSTGKREVYIAQSSSSIAKWGVLTYTETMQKGESGKTKANALLNLYNHKERTLELKNVLADEHFRAGRLVKVNLQLRDMQIRTYMLIEKCEHIINQDEVLTNLTLRGGEFGG